MATRFTSAISESARRAEAAITFLARSSSTAVHHTLSRRTAVKTLSAGLAGLKSPRELSLPQIGADKGEATRLLPPVESGVH
jgi:hypothetical protein